MQATRFDSHPQLGSKKPAGQAGFGVDISKKRLNPAQQVERVDDKHRLVPALRLRRRGELRRVALVISDKRVAGGQVAEAGKRFLALLLARVPARLQLAKMRPHHVLERGADAGFGRDERLTRVADPIVPVGRLGSADDVVISQQIHKRISDPDADRLGIGGEIHVRPRQLVVAAHLDQRRQLLVDEVQHVLEIEFRGDQAVCDAQIQLVQDADGRECVVFADKDPGPAVDRAQDARHRERIIAAQSHIIARLSAQILPHPTRHRLDHRELVLDQRAHLVDLGGVVVIDIAKHGRDPVTDLAKSESQVADLARAAPVVLVVFGGRIDDGHMGRLGRHEDKTRLSEQMVNRRQHEIGLTALVTHRLVIEHRQRRRDRCVFETAVQIDHSQGELDRVVNDVALIVNNGIDLDQIDVKMQSAGETAARRTLKRLQQDSVVGQLRLNPLGICPDNRQRVAADGERVLGRPQGDKIVLDRTQHTPLELQLLFRQVPREQEQAQLVEQVRGCKHQLRVSANPLNHRQTIRHKFPPWLT